MKIKSFDDYYGDKLIDSNPEKHQLSKEEVQLAIKRLINLKKRAVLDCEINFADGVACRSSIDNLLTNYRNAELALNDVQILQQIEASLFPKE